LILNMAPSRALNDADHRESVVGHMGGGNGYAGDVDHRTWAPERHPITDSRVVHEGGFEYVRARDDRCVVVGVGGGSWTGVIAWTGGGVSRGASRWRRAAFSVARAWRRALISAICSTTSQGASGGSVESRVLYLLKVDKDLSGRFRWAGFLCYYERRRRQLAIGNG
jgi:hypothetical protein